MWRDELDSSLSSWRDSQWREWEERYASREREASVPELPLRSQVPERLPFAADGFDQVIYGGIPRQNVVLISGTPGSGKSLLVRQAALVAALGGVPTVVYTAEEHPYELVESYRRYFGVDITPFLSARLIRVVYLCYVCPKTSSFDVISLYDKPQKGLASDMYRSGRAGYKLSIVDSVSLLWSSAPSTARSIMVQLHGAAKASRQTALIVSQIGREEEGFGGPGVEHASDGLIQMRLGYYEGVLRRLLRVPKMRNSKHTPYQHVYEIESGLKLEWTKYAFGTYKLTVRDVPRERVVEMAKATAESYRAVAKVFESNWAETRELLKGKADELDSLHERLIIGIEQRAEELEGLEELSEEPSEGE